MVRKRNDQSKSKAVKLPLMRPNAAGIDVGAEEMFVAVPPDRVPDNVRSFDTFTQDLYRLAQWLKDCGVDSVAMESTGVFWIPLFQILVDAGFEVFLVNARHVKNVPGRKTDILDCQWLQYLHSVGLLTASFRPAQNVCAIRSLLRHRQSLIRLAGSHVQHMQKAMTQMNLQIHHVLSDITGKTGLAIIDAILAGERDPHILAQLRDKRVKAKEDVIAKSLVGDYRPEHVFTLRQSVAAYRHYQGLISACDSEINKLIHDFAEPDASSGDPFGRTQPPAQDPSEDGFLHCELKRLFGVDLTAIPGLAIDTVLTLFGEIGADFSKFRSMTAFASWLTLCPDNEISGGKVLRTKTRQTTSRAKTALRMAAHSLHRSQSFLGEFYRRMRAKLGAPKAITATAHKLARIIYQLVTTRQEYDESQLISDHTHHRHRQEGRLRAKAKALGFTLLPLEPATA